MPDEPGSDCAIKRSLLKRQSSSRHRHGAGSSLSETLMREGLFGLDREISGSSGSVPIANVHEYAIVAGVFRNANDSGLPVLRGYEVAGMKAAMEMLGMSAGPVRPPLRECSQADLADLRQLMGIYREML